MYTRACSWFLLLRCSLILLVGIFWGFSGFCFGCFFDLVFIFGFFAALVFLVYLVFGFFYSFGGFFGFFYDFFSGVLNWFYSPKRVQFLKFSCNSFFFVYNGWRGCSDAVNVTA